MPYGNTHHNQTMGQEEDEIRWQQERFAYFEERRKRQEKQKKSSLSLLQRIKARVELHVTFLKLFFTRVLARANNFFVCLTNMSSSYQYIRFIKEEIVPEITDTTRVSCAYILQLCFVHHDGRSYGTKVYSSASIQDSSNYHYLTYKGVSIRIFAKSNEEKYLEYALAYLEKNRNIENLDGHTFKFEEPQNKSMIEIE